MSTESERPSEPPVPLPSELVEALQADINDGVDARSDEWAGFEAAVWARIDETTEAELGADATWPAIASALRADHHDAVADFEAHHAAFADGVALRWAEQSEASARETGAVTVGDVLRAEVDEAVEVRERAGAWSPFAQQVLRTIEDYERDQAAVSDRLAHAMREEVDAELDALASRFDRDFREGVERRIFRAAREARPWWSEFSDAVRAWLSPRPTFGFAVAAAAAVVFAVVLPRTSTGPGTVAVPEVDSGHVSISAVRFDGTVTVMPDDGIAVVWVSNDAS